MENDEIAPELSEAEAAPQAIAPEGGEVTVLGAPGVAGEEALEAGPAAVVAELVEILSVGGPVVAILAGMSLIAAALVLAKVWQFAVARPERRREVDAAVVQFRAGDVAAARSTIATAKGVMAGPVAVAVEALAAGRSPAQARADSFRIASEQLEALRCYMRPLEVIASLAPLLGLFGTVLGMIAAFAALEAAGSQVDPAILSGGIWEALLTTAVGLAVAIPSVAMVNWFERRIERCEHGLESALTALFAADAAAPDAARPPMVAAAE